MCPCCLCAGVFRQEIQHDRFFRCRIKQMRTHSAECSLWRKTSWICPCVDSIPIPGVMIGEGDDMVGLHVIEQPDVWDFGKFFRRRGNANGLSSANFRIRFCFAILELFVCAGPGGDSKCCCSAQIMTSCFGYREMSRVQSNSFRELPATLELIVFVRCDFNSIRNSHSPEFSFASTSSFSCSISLQVQFAFPGLRFQVIVMFCRAGSSGKHSTHDGRGPLDRKWGSTSWNDFPAFNFAWIQLPYSVLYWCVCVDQMTDFRRGWISFTFFPYCADCSVELILSLFPVCVGQQ